MNYKLLLMALGSLAQIPFDISSLSGKPYLIAMRKDITEIQWTEHRELAHKTLDGTFGYTLEEICDNLGVAANTISIPLTPQELELSIKQAKIQYDTFSSGLFDFGDFKGYHGHFPLWLIELLRKIPLIELIEDDIVMSATQSSTDILQDQYFKQAVDANLQIQPNWGLDRISHKEPGYLGRYIYPASPGKNVDIYIVDSGVLLTHMEFQNRATKGLTVATDGDNDLFNHGTHVAAIAAGETYGIAKEANIISVKALQNDGQASSSAIISAIEWVAKNVVTTKRRSVINLSIGGNSTVVTVRTAVETAYNLGIAISVAAGNDKQDACNSSPQDSDFVFTVGAVDQEDKRAGFSNFGKCVDIWGPGTNITSASSTNYNHNMIKSGTSATAPFVAGQMAILLSMYPEISVADLYATLRSAGTPGVVQGRTEDDVDLMLFNSVKTVALGGGGKGDNFIPFVGNGWTLVNQVLASAFI